MKPMRTKRFGWLAMGVAFLLSLKMTTHAQGRPDIVWMVGGHADRVSFVAFSPDGQYLASGGWDNTIKLWRVSDGALVRTLTGHTLGVLSVAFSPDDPLLASGDWDNTIKLWRVPDGAEVRTITRGGGASITFSPIAQALASVGGWRIKFWRVSDGALLQTYDQEIFDSRSLQFSPNGYYFAYGRPDATIVLARSPLAPPEGDVTGDVCVDDSDLLVVLFAFGSSGSGLPEDVNNDGMVDDADLLIVLFNFGSGC